jgi:O-antigen/teichoic acid export membrane protein
LRRLDGNRRWPTETEDCMVSEYKLFVQRVGLVSITNVLVSLSPLILLPILTKELPIEQYGIWVQASVTITLLSYLLSVGLPFTFVRFFAAWKQKEEQQEGFYSFFFITLFINIVALILILTFSGAVARGLFAGDDFVAQVLPVVITFTCLNSLLVNYFRTFLRMRIFSLFSLIQTYFGVILVGYFVASGRGINGGIIGLLLAQIAVFVPMMVLVIAELGFKLPKFSNTREHLSFSAPLLPWYVSSWIVDSSDRYIIYAFLGAAYVGYYSPGYALGNVILMLATPITFMLPAVLSKYYDEGNLVEVKTVLAYSFKYIMLIAIPACFALSLLSKAVLSLLTTQEIAAHGYVITPFVAVGALFVSAYSILLQVLVLKKKTPLLGTVWISAAVLNVGLNVLLVPHLGMIGAALTTLVAYVLVFVVIATYALRFLYFHIDVKSVLKSLCASLVMSLVIVYLAPTGYPHIIGTLLLSLIVYVAVLAGLRGFSSNELAFFKTLLQKGP